LSTAKLAENLAMHFYHIGQFGGHRIEGTRYRTGESNGAEAVLKKRGKDATCRFVFTTLLE
jgi:hypothetical protein